MRPITTVRVVAAGMTNNTALMMLHPTTLSWDKRSCIHFVDGPSWRKAAGLVRVPDQVS